MTPKPARALAAAFVFQLLRRFVTSVNQAFGAQLFDDFAVTLQTGGLMFQPVPRNLQPVQRFVNGGFVFGLGPFRVGVVHSQNERHVLARLFFIQSKQIIEKYMLKQVHDELD